MAIGTATCTMVGRLLWRLYAESDLTDQATFYVWVDGMLHRSFSGSALDGGGWFFEYYYTAPPDGDQDIAVYDDGAAVQEGVYPRRAHLQWERVATAAEYWIEEYVGSAWVLRKIVRETGQRWIHAFTSRALEDCETHTFRVRAKGANEMFSVARTFSVRVVGRPDPPDIEHTYDEETAVVTVSAA